MPIPVPHDDHGRGYVENDTKDFIIFTLNDPFARVTSYFIPLELMIVTLAESRKRKRWS